MNHSRIGRLEAFVSGAIGRNAAVALAMRTGSSTVDWSAALPFLVTGAAGTVVDGRIGERRWTHAA